MEAQPETNTASEEKHSFPWAGFIVWPLVILVLYVLSFGPVGLMLEKGRIDPNNPFVGKFYDPWVWAYSETLLHKPLEMYLHLWVPSKIDRDGEPKPEK